MVIQEIYNHNHRLRTIPLGIRAAYIFPAFVLALFSKSVYFHIELLVFFFALSRVFGKTSVRNLLHLYRYPLLFVLLGSFTLAISFNSSQPFFFLPNTSIGMDDTNAKLALKVLFRSLAVLSLIYFGLLTHTISEISNVMRSLRVPRIFIELFVLTYKFIFNLLSIAQGMYTAQKSRLAYTKRSNNLKAFTLLSFAVFRKAIQQSYQLEIALNARLSRGEFIFLCPKNHFEKKQIIAPSILTFTLIVSFVILQNYVR